MMIGKQDEQFWNGLVPALQHVATAISKQTGADEDKLILGWLKGPVMQASTLEGEHSGVLGLLTNENKTAHTLKVVNHKLYWGAIVDFVAYLAEETEVGIFAPEAKDFYQKVIARDFSEMSVEAGVGVVQKPIGDIAKAFGDQGRKFVQSLLTGKFAHMATVVKELAAAKGDKHKFVDWKKVTAASLTEENCKETGPPRHN